MAKELTQDELIERHRADTLVAFGVKSMEIQKEIVEYQSKLETIESQFEIEYAKLIDSNKQLEEELRNKIHVITDKEALVNAALKDARMKLDNAKSLEDLLASKHAEHNEVVEHHAKCCANDKDDILSRISAAKVVEDSAHALMISADQKMVDATTKEQSITEQSEKLTSISNNIASDIAIQKDLQIKNESIKKDIVLLKEENEKLSIQAKQDKADAIEIRDNCDRASARLTTKGIEVDRRNEACTAREVQIKVTDKILSDRKSFLDYQEGRLNELRNNVNTLLEKQKAAIGESK